MDEPIAVIGGGIAGASVAYHLAFHTDAPVTVYERDALGSATTTKSTAVFRLMAHPLLDRMKRDAMALYNEFLAAPRTSVRYELLGRLEVATTDDGAAGLRETELVTGSYLEGDELASTLLFPTLDTAAVAGALYQPNAGYFRPSELTHEFVERAREAGVTFRTGTEVLDVQTDGGTVSAVRTTAGTDRVAHVVAAAGPWNPEIARLVGLEPPIRHTLAPILRLAPPTDATHTVPNVKHTESGYYVVGQADGSVLVGHSPGSYAAAGTEYDPDAVSESVPTSVRDGMTDTLGTLLPSLLDADTVEEWVGIRSLTPDGLPMVGPTPVDGLSIVAFNSEGIQLAPAAGRVIASEVAGTERPPYAADVSPLRFDDWG